MPGAGRAIAKVFGRWAQDAHAPVGADRALAQIPCGTGQLCRGLLRAAEEAPSSRLTRLGLIKMS